MRLFKQRAQDGRFSHRTRRAGLERMKAESFDLVVIGGGITGAGIARDAALRGMKVALLEKGDFGSGTSSRSSKLIHGGLRYLKQLYISLVKESLTEQRLLLQLAPHLVRPLPFLIPIYAGWSDRIEKWIGMIGYDLLKRGNSLLRHRNLSSEEVLELEPLLRREKLSGGFIYYDCNVDDARLTLITLKSAALEGAVVANYTQAAHIECADRKWCQVGFQDHLSGISGMLKARLVVGAGGPWTDELLHLIDHPRPVLRVTKGVHIVVPRQRLHVEHAVVLPTENKRFIFTVPKGDFTYIGTTDTDYDGSLDDVTVDAADARYLLENTNRCFPWSKLAAADIVSAWAGLRPLLREVGDPSKISRDYSIGHYASGLVIITGGKLTTYRHMAENLLDQVLSHYADRFEADFASCRTTEVPLVGGEMAEFNAYLTAQTLALTDRWKLSQAAAERLVNNYGRNHMDILALGFGEPALMELVHPDYPMLKAEVAYAVEEEMAVTLDDLLSRRTDWALFDRRRGAPLVKPAAALMGRLLGWSRRRRLSEVQHYQRKIENELRFKTGRAC